MDIDYTVAALMFPAIPLMMTMYSNRFHTLSALIRKIHDQYTFEKKIPPEWENQLHVLNKRTNFLKYVMGFSSFGFLFNMLNRNPKEEKPITYLRKFVLLFKT